MSNQETTPGRDTMTSTAKERLLRLPEVMSRTGKSRTSVYNSVKNGTMPAPIKFSRRFTAWTESSIDTWIAQAIERATKEQ